VRIGKSIVPVRRNSLIATAFEDGEELPAARRMEWSLGALADLLWLLLPESRPFLIALVKQELERAAENGRELSRVLSHEVARAAFWEPLFEPALVCLPEERESAVRYCEFARIAYEFDDRDRDLIREVLDDEVLEPIISSAHLWAVEEIDPSLYTLVIGRYGQYYDTSPERPINPKT
jgi:hypothetical protein